MGQRINAGGPATGGDDRRNTERYKANGTSLRLEWVADGVSRAAPGLLKDVSMRGALVETDATPDPGTSVRIHTNDGGHGGGIEATAVRVFSPRRPGFSLFRRAGQPPHLSLQFREPCPYEFFKAAIDGFVVEVGHLNQADPQFNSRDWR